MTSDKSTRRKPGDDKTRHYASDLHEHVGEWISDPFVCDFPVLLTFAAEKPNPSTGKVTIVFEARGESTPGMIQAGTEIVMATDAEVEREKRQVERSTVVDGLVELANLLADQRLPIRDYLGSITLHNRLTREELAEVAKVIGVEPARSYGTTFEVEWHAKGTGPYGPGLRAGWSATYPACPFVLVNSDDEDLADLDEAWVERGERVYGEPCKFEDGHDGEHGPKVRPAVKS